MGIRLGSTAFLVRGVIVTDDTRDILYLGNLYSRSDLKLQGSQAGKLLPRVDIRNTGTTQDIK